jgi:glycosyltransferase involved in cell wall biosynthesis
VTTVPVRDQRPRVLTLALVAGSGYGGAEKVAYEFARRLDRQRFASYLCKISLAEWTTAESQARDAQELAARGVSVLSLNQPGPMLLTPTAWRRLYSLLARESIDVVHAHMPRASIPGAILARLAGVPVMVSHEHGSVLEGRRIRTFLDREVVARLSTVVIAVSEWDRRNLIEHGGIPADRIRVLPNGIAAVGEPSADAAPALERPPGAHLIGAVGRLYREKGYEDLIHAVSLLKARGLGLRCVIAGDGPDRAELQDLIDRLDLAHEVQLLGRREDVPQIIGELDVAVLSSVREGSPLAVLEYMAGGAPIVATGVGGVPELIHDDEHGLLVAPGDPQALASGIARLLNDRALAARLGAAARARQLAEYDLDGLMRRLENLYVELLGESGVRQRRRRRI